MMLLRSRLPITLPRRPAAVRDIDRHVDCPIRQSLNVLATVLAAMAILVGGCFEAEIPAPSATVSPMTSNMRPAKGPNCPLQVLYTMPSDSVQQLALIDTWGDEEANDADLLPTLKGKACGIGADAVVITSDKSQHEGDQLAGYDDKVGSSINNKAANVSQRMHDPTVGEVGHKGHYLSAVAIAFTRGGQTPTQDTTSSAGQ
jgi:hypothetical protein